MTETKPKRRWFRFSLRMLFVLVTIVGVAAGWVAYQLNWIRERREFWLNNNWNPGATMVAEEPPWSLRVFGEVGKGWNPVYPPRDIHRAKALFPEMVFHWDHPEIAVPSFKSRENN